MKICNSKFVLHWMSYEDLQQSICVTLDVILRCATVNLRYIGCHMKICNSKFVLHWMLYEDRKQ